MADALEAAIDRALSDLSPADFQRLAEAYAEIRWAQRYAHLVPQGRNAFNATTAGWPDAWAPSPTGDIHAVEASLDANWGRHLDRDIDDVHLRQGAVESFVFVSAARQPEEKSLEPRLAALSRAGIAAGDVDLIFRQRLCRELAHSRFARVRATLLKLPASPTPFVDVDKARGLFGDGSPAAFAPTKEEYSIPGGVWQNEVLPRARLHLERRGWAYVEGHGASGKTVLCTQLGLEWIGDLKPAYYLDMTTGDGELPRIVETMTHYGGEDVLFIVDNVHIAELVVGELFDNWRSRQDGSRLLLSGRNTSVDPWSGTGDCLHDVRKKAVPVRAGPEDILGTYRRLVGRIGREDVEPSRFLIHRWTKLFRGDLVAFGAALVREHRVGRPFGELSAEDAVDYVSEAYLDPYAGDPQARRDLVTISALSVLEIPAPVSLVSPARLKPSLGSGAVLRSHDRHTLSAAHPGLARLLLAGAGRTEIDVETLTQCAERDGDLARLIIGRLFERREWSASLAICRSLVAQGDWAVLLHDSLEDFVGIIDGIRRTAEVSWEELDRTAARTLDWAEAIRRTSVRHLIPVLRICAARMPLCSAELQAVLFPEDRPSQWLVERLKEAGPALNSQFRGVVGKFFESVGWDDPSAEDRERWVDSVATGIARRGLKRRAWRDLLACIGEGPGSAAALDSRLAALDDETWIKVISLGSARRVRRLINLGLPQVEARVGGILSDRRLAEEWVRSASEGGPATLTLRMTQAYEALPDLHRAVSEELGRAGDAEVWADRTLRPRIAPGGKAVGRRGGIGRAVALSLVCPEDALPFVERADCALGSAERRPALRAAMKTQTAESLGQAVREAPRRWPRFDARLVEFACDREVTAALALELSSAPLSELRLMLVDHPLAHAVIAEVVPATWELGRPVLEAGKSYSHFPAVAAGLARFGREELARPPALQLAGAIVRKEVPLRRLRLTHASHLFRLLPSTENRLREELASRLSEGDWLSSMPSMLSVNETAQALYSLWCYGPELMRFVTPDGFKHRLVTELDGGPRTAALRLWGAVSLICDEPLPQPGWLSSAFASELLDYPRWQIEYLRPGAVQTLLGLRAASASGAELCLPESQIVAALARLSATDAKNARQAELGESLAAWLEESLEMGGKLYRHCGSAM
ncbi:MAG TPA: hypothetical protein VF085_09870 [Solirubrobacterales bacterium]